MKKVSLMSLLCAELFSMQAGQESNVLRDVSEKTQATIVVHHIYRSANSNTQQEKIIALEEKVAYFRNVIKNKDFLISYYYAKAMMFGLLCAGFCMKDVVIQFFT